MLRKIWCLVFMLALVFTLISFQGEINAENKYPIKPITIICPASAGGSTDLSLRVLAKIVGDELGQPMVVQDKPGGGSIIGLALVANAKPDGYTIGATVTGPATIAQHLRDIPFDPLEDFEYIMQYGYYKSAVVVRSDSPIHTFKEFIEHCRKNPKTLVGMNGSVGMPQHLVLERVKRIEGVEWEWQPYGGGAAAMTALLGGHVDAAAPGSEFANFVRDGSVRPLVLLCEKNIEEFPDLPTLLDLGYGFSGPSLVGMVAPKGTPKEICQKLEEAFTKAISHPDFKEIVQKMQLGELYRSGKDFKENVIKVSKENYEVLKELKVLKDQ